MLGCAVRLTLFPPLMPQRTGPLAQIAGNTVSALGDVADRARAIAARSHSKDRHVVHERANGWWVIFQ